MSHLEERLEHDLNEIRDQIANMGSSVEQALQGAFRALHTSDDKLAFLLDEPLSNVDAQPHTDPGEIRGLLARQVCGVVEWQASMEVLLSTGVGRLWEVGPGRVLRGLLKRIDRKRPCQGVLDG